MIKGAVFIILLFQALSCIHAAVSRKIVNGDDVFDFVGRFTVTDMNTYQANWPYSGVRFNVESLNSTSEVVVNFSNCVDKCNYFIEAFVDCTAVQKFEVNSVTSSLILIFNSVPGHSYELQFRKVTEASNGDATGVMEFGAIELNGAEFIPKKKALRGVTNHNCLRRHKLLVIGDSITAAYGVDGVSPCTFSASTENADHSYAELVAKEVQADLHVVAWSGRGVVRNYGDVNQISADTMPALYNRTIATLPVSSDPSDGNFWSPKLFPADIVLVMLGTNDYSTQPNPTDEQFIGGYVDLLARIAVDYPQAKGQVAALCAPMQTGHQCANIQAAAQQAGVQYVFVDPSAMSGGYGCDGHPNAASEQNIANVVAPAVRAMLNP